jgi:hypothetical protein
MVRSVSLVFACFLISTAASAQTQVSPHSEQQVGPHSEQEDDACRGDVHRFCRDAEPDELRVLSCLQMNRARLTKACQGVLQSHGM